MAEFRQGTSEEVKSGAAQYRAGAIFSDQASTPVSTGSGAKTPITHRVVIYPTQDDQGKVNGAERVLYIEKNGRWQPAAISKDGGKTYQFSNPNYPTMTGVAGVGLQNDLKSRDGAIRKNLDANTNQAITRAGVPQIQKKTIIDSIKNNGDQTGNGSQQGSTPLIDIGEALKDVKARTDYEQNLVYPVGLKLQFQDCIKFSVIQYSASGLNLDQASNKERRVSLNGVNPTVDNRKILTTITLPIPGGISDSNNVDWSSSSLDEATRALANVAQSTISDGGQSGASVAKGELNNVAQNAPAFTSLAAAKFTEAAIGKSAGILQRQYGAVINPNMELLFNGPLLRTFGFTFKLSPRSKEEAIKVKKIIRYFKQAMSTKRSPATLLLQAPHTFAISYLSSNKQHPYLNKFKECALTSCNVNYVPDGTYMTFMGPEPSMTSYELTLQFQELVPLFDDDYGNDNDNIGY